MLHWVDKETPVKIYLDIRERILYKKVKPSCKESFWTQEKPAKNSKQLLCGFFYPAPKSILPGSAKGESFTKIFQKLAKNWKGGVGYIERCAI